MDWTSKYFLVAVAAGLVILCLKRVVENQLKANVNARTKRPLYRADHSILNIRLPPESMWMNMGFWKDTDDFATACRALLEEVLKSAQVWQAKASASNKNLSRTLSIIDLGFGCGDQCIYMKGVMEDQIQTKNDDPCRRLLRAYVGITLESSHVCIAQERLDLLKQQGAQPDDNTVFEIYCADAGKPASWSVDVRNAISMACEVNDQKEHHETWLLGLDSLIHFQPSRWPVIEYANKTLGASLMAFDLCIAENLSMRQRIILRLMAFLGHSPSANWVTIREYRERLVMAGYARERIDIRDVSEHVFGPLARFLRKKEHEAQQYGLSIGRFRYTAKMFDWWSRTGVIRGCIIVARK